MLAAIYYINTENWNNHILLGNGLVGNSLVGRESDIEVEDEEFYDDFEDDDDEPERESTPNEDSDVFREDDENMTIAECF
jgi:hypothetical protein